MGKSIKPGNILLNWRKLVEVIPDTAIATVGGLNAPSWVIPLIALYVWNKIWAKSKEELSQVEATIIYALWINKDSKNQISEVNGYNNTNIHRKKLDLQPLSKSEFNDAINKLFRIQCVEVENGILWLREWVSNSY